MWLMSQDSEKIKEAVQKESKKLAELGKNISQIKFSYKVKESSSKKYWVKRTEEFKSYSKAGLEYYNQIYSLMKLINQEESKLFLLQISKFNQLASALVEMMEKIKENPTIGNSKDKQQSIWSKDIRQDITRQSNDCLNHEKKINLKFREFYEENLKHLE